MLIKTKKNIFALGVILMSIFQLLQVHIIPREYSNDNLAKKFVHTLPHLAILKHNFHSLGFQFWMLGLALLVETLSETAIL